MNLFRLLALSLIVLAFSGNASITSAQHARFSENTFHHWDFGANFMVGVPQGAFRQNIEKPGFGVDMFGVYHLKRLPFGIGADFGFITYGTSRRNEPFNPNIPEVTVRVSTSNNITFGHLMARIQPSHGTIQPYVDGLVGVSYLFTQSRVTDDQELNEIASSTNFEDVAFSGGIAAGTKIRLTEIIDQETGRKTRLYLDLRVRYIRGGEAEYLKEGSITVENGQMLFESNYSRTDLMTFNLGFTLSM